MRKLRRWIVAALVPGILAGCGGQYAVHGATPTQQTAIIVDGGLTISIALSEAAATAISVVGIVGLVAVGNGMTWDPPRMKEDRAINEQDCTKPIVNLTANLKCK
jgi:hypothetical protein